MGVSLVGLGIKSHGTGQGQQQFSSQSISQADRQTEGPLADSCEQDNETSGSIRGGDDLHCLDDCWHLITFVHLSFCF